MKCPKCGGHVVKSMVKAFIDPETGVWFPGFYCPACREYFSYIEVVGEEKYKREKERHRYREQVKMYGG